jgi:hypothetical protein
MSTWRSPLRVLFCRQNEVRSSQCCKTLNYSEQSPRKATFSRAGQKFPAYYGTRRFITVFTTARHVFLTCARWTLSATSYLVSLRSILISSSRFRLFTMLHCFREWTVSCYAYARICSSSGNELAQMSRRMTQCCPTVSLIPIQRPCSGWHLLSASLP